MRKFFENWFHSETQKDSPTKTLGFVRQKPWQKSVIQPPLLLSIKFFDTRNFLKHRRVALRTFSVLWDKNFDKKMWYTSSSLIHKIFRYTDFSEAQTCSPTKPLDSARQNINSTKRRYPLLMRKIFRNSIFSETQKGSPTKFFGTVRQKF